MDRGYVCLWRKLRDSDVIKDQRALQVFIALLVHSGDTSIKCTLPNGEAEVINPGEVFITYDSFSSGLGIDILDLVHALAKLEDMEIIKHIPLETEYGEPLRPLCAFIIIREWSTYQPPMFEDEYLDDIQMDDGVRDDQ